MAGRGSIQPGGWVGRECRSGKKGSACKPSPEFFRALDCDWP